jgi:hypothetical protein
MTDFKSSVLVKHWILSILVLLLTYQSAFADLNPIVLSLKGQEIGSQDMIAVSKKDIYRQGHQGKDFATELQHVINTVSTDGGGIIYLGAGDYILNTTVYLKNGVSIKGIDSATTIRVKSKTAISQQDADFVEGISISGITFKNADKAIAGDAVFHLKSHAYSRFSNLKFFGFEDRTIFHIAPNYNKKPAKNAVFNSYSDMFILSCKKGVVYEGQSYSVISNNVWRNITMRKVYAKAIEGIRWVDSERWYSLYAQAWDSNVILIDLNVSKTTWDQVDRIHFYSPTLVYSPKLTSSPVAIRFGMGTFKHFFYGVISDKLWTNFIVDEGAKSYYIMKGSSAGGFKENPGILSKGFDSN